MLTAADTAEAHYVQLTVGHHVTTLSTFSSFVSLRPQKCSKDIVKYDTRQPTVPRLDAKLPYI